MSPYITQCNSTGCENNQRTKAQVIKTSGMRWTALSPPDEGLRERSFFETSPEPTSLSLKEAKSSWLEFKAAGEKFTKNSSDDLADE